MFSGAPRRVRCLTDCIPASSDSLRQQDQQQAQRVPQSAKLAARLALTCRYRIHLPQSSDDKPSRERMREHEDAADRKERREQLPNFTLYPPEPSLLRSAVRLLDDSRITAEAGKMSYHRALIHVLDQEESTAGLKSLSRQRSRELHTRVRELRQLVGYLTQQSSMSCQLGMGFAAARDRHMFEETRVCYRLPSKQPQDIINQTVYDADDLIRSSDFPPLYFGNSVGSEFEHSSGRRAWLEQQMQQLEQERDRDLLFVRMLLVSEPFIVSCTGADHMGAFLLLAKWQDLHLQLLPSRSHVDTVLQ